MKWNTRVLGISNLTKQLVAATNDAARAELRAKDLLASTREELRCPGSPYPDDPAHWCATCDSRLTSPSVYADAAAPDSDARLREVIRREQVKFANWLSEQLQGVSLHPEETVGEYDGSLALEHTGIDEVLRGGA